MGRLSKQEKLKDLEGALRAVAMMARGMVLIGETTEQEIAEYVAEKSNAEWKKIFSMSDSEIVIEMLYDAIDMFNELEIFEELERETK